MLLESIIKCPERIHSQNKVCSASSRASFGVKFILHRLKPKNVPTNVNISYSVEPSRYVTLNAVCKCWIFLEKYKWDGHLADMAEVLPHRFCDHLFTFSSFFLCFRAVPTFYTIIMPFGDELAACCGFTTAFAIKTAFPYCWEVLTRVLQPNSKAAYIDAIKAD